MPENVDDLRVAQFLRDETYGQLRHAQNLQQLQGVASIFVAPAAARDRLQGSPFLESNLPRRPGVRTLTEARRLARALRPLNPDLIHAHSIATLPAAMLVARMLRLPLVHSPHALPVSGLSGSRAEVGVAFALVKLAGLTGASFVAVSEGERKRLAALVGTRRLFAAPNPVPPGYLAKPPHDRDPGLIVSLSRFWPQKQPLLTIDAFAALRLRVPSARLAWAGDGPLMDDAYQLARALGVADGIDFLGAVPDPLPLLQRAAVLLSTSSFEAMPYSILEAMAAGAAVVATDIPAHQEIDGGRAVLALELANPDRLASAMATFLRDETKRTAQAESARRAVLDGHTIADFANATTRAYLATLGLPARLHLAVETAPEREAA